MKTQVISRNVNISPRKAGLVCTLIRGRKIKDAIAILNNTEKKSSAIILKMLNSAIANASNNHNMVIDNLYIFNAIANKGTYLKRTMPRARGSADIILKRFSHLQIILSDDINERKKDLENIKKTTGSKKENLIKNISEKVKGVKK